MRLNNNYKIKITNNLTCKVYFTPKKVRVSIIKLWSVSDYINRIIDHWLIDNIYNEIK
jgi:hypothetical protein